MNLSRRYFIFEIIKNLIIIHLIASFFIIVITKRLVESSKIEVSRIGNLLKSEIMDNNSIFANEYFNKISSNTAILDAIKSSDSKTLIGCLSISNLESIYIFNERNKLIYNNENNSIKFHVFKDQIKLNMLNSNIRKSFFLGNEYGIYYFKIFHLYQGKEFIGKLLVCFEITKDKYLYFIKNGFHVDSSIFFNEVRVKTTISRNGINQRGTLIDNSIYNKILSSTTSYVDKVNILGEEYMAVYIPILHDDENIITMFVGKPMDIIYKDIRKTSLFIISISSIIILIISLLAYFRIKTVYIRQILDVDKKILDFTNKRNLISRNKIDLVNSKNEIDSLKNSFNYMEYSIIEYEKQIEYQLYHDPVTNLKNMFYLYQKYHCLNYSNKEHCTLTCNKESCQQSSSLYLISINNINNINVKFGSSFGDLVILEVGKLLEKFSIKHNIEIYKCSGTKFLLLLTSENINCVDKIIKIFERAIIVKSVSLNITINIGIVENKEKINSMSELLKRVNIALNTIATENIFKTSYYNEKMLLNITDLFEIENDIKIGLEKSEFYLVYQPKIDVLSNQVIGFEALVRWTHPKKGEIFPNRFIEIAESTGLIIPLGNYILRESLLFIKNINLSSKIKYSVAVNFSVIQILQEDFINNINLLINEYGVNPEYLHIEITETVLIESYEVIIEKLNSLKLLGVKIDLDDFGTGYSSLNYLKNLPIDSLKIDKSFIDSLQEEDSKNLVVDIINIGKKLGLIVVAEGIETEKQLNLIKKYNCNIAQGYLFSKPIKEVEVIKYISKHI